MMIWNRARCAWVKWTGSKAAWLALPAASAIVVSACLPVINARMPLGPAIAHQTTHRASTVFPVTPMPHVAIAPSFDYVGTPSVIVPPTAPVESVPEPGSLILLATAVAALLLVRRRV